MKRALILGIGGMDGSYLAELLLDKGYVVHGMYRRSSSDNLWRIRHLIDDSSKALRLYQGDVLDTGSLYRIINDVEPEEIYNEADQDHVGTSYDTPVYSMQVTAGAVIGLLESVRHMLGRGHLPTTVKIFQPLSATMFGNSPPPQNETSPLNPQSPYAIAKVAAWYACQHYRREYGIHVSTAIFYNHDSSRRQGDYLLHKLVKGALDFKYRPDKAKKIDLGDAATPIDIGYAPEYMQAAWRIVQLDKPDDFVIGTGVGAILESVVKEVFGAVGFSESEISRFVSFNAYHRLGEQRLIADTAKASGAFNFYSKTGYRQIVRMLVEHYERNYR